MHIFTKQFFEYCQRSFDLEEYSDYNYQSLSVCIIDCVYSLRAKYQSVTVPIVDRCAALYLNGNRNNPGDTVSMLIQHIEESGGARHFADNVLKNHQKLGGKQKFRRKKSATSWQNICVISILRRLRTFEILSHPNYWKL